VVRERCGVLRVAGDERRPVDRLAERVAYHRSVFVRRVPNQLEMGYALRSATPSMSASFTKSPYRSPSSRAAARWAINRGPVTLDLTGVDCWLPGTADNSEAGARK
jgi:hypothetical protein